MFSTSMSSVYVSLSLFNQGVYGCPFHVFSKSLFQLGSPLILVTAPELTRFSYSYFRMSWNIEAFSLCMFLTSTKLSEWSPMERRAPAQGLSRDQCIRGPSSGTTLTQFYSYSTNTFIMSLLQVLCAQYVGITHHRVLQTSRWGWADSKAVHGMECSGACSLYWRSLSVGAAA